LVETGLHHDVGGRNTYPDFRMVRFTEGYEVKGLAYPGREEFSAWRVTTGSREAVVLREASQMASDAGDENDQTTED
jgi:hypothetical protein